MVFYMCSRYKNNKQCDILKIVLIAIGAVTATVALVIGIKAIFKAVSKKLAKAANADDVICDCEEGCCDENCCGDPCCCGEAYVEETAEEATEEKPAEVTE